MSIEKIRYLIQLHKVEQAFTLVSEELKNEPTNPELLFLGGLCNSVLYKDQLAEQFFLQALQFDSESVDTLIQLAILSTRAKKYGEVEKYCQKSINIQPAQEYAYTNLALKNFRKGEAKQCLRNCKLALEFNPNSVRAKCILANLYILQDKTTLAKESIDSALESEPNNPQVLLSLAKFLQSNNESKRAFDLIKEALSKSPDNPSLRLAVKQLIGSQSSLISKVYKIISDAVFKNELYFTAILQIIFFLSSLISIFIVFIWFQLILEVVLLFLLINFSMFMAALLGLTNLSNFLIYLDPLGKLLISNKELYSTLIKLSFFLSGFIIIATGLVDFIEDQSNLVVLNLGMIVIFVPVALRRAENIHSKKYTIISLLLFVLIVLSYLLFILNTSNKFYLIATILLFLSHTLLTFLARKWEL